MISVAKAQRRNAWRYYVRGVAFGDGRRPVGQSLKDAQEMAGLPPGAWRGRGLAALGLTDGQVVTERQMKQLFGEGRHPGADRVERELLDDGVDTEAARRATVLGQPIEEIEQRKQTPLIALDFVFRPQASLIVLWALGDERTRRVIERAIAATLRWLEDEVAETRWASGRQRAKAPALVAAASTDCRHDTQEIHTGDVDHLGKKYAPAGDPQAVTANQTAGMPEALAAAIRDVVADTRPRSHRRPSTRDADKLECMLQGIEYKAQGYENAQRWIDNSWARLVTETGRRLADELLGQGPLDWLRTALGEPKP